MADPKVKGLSQLDKFMQQLPAKLEQNVLRGGLRAGMKVVLPAVKAGAPKDTGQMAAGFKLRTAARRGQVSASIRAGGPHGHLAHWMEYGTTAHRIVAKDGGWLFLGGSFAKSVEHPGIAPRPFMAPALIANTGPAIVATANYMKQRLATKHGLETADVEIEIE
jgi:HK97 gp10 family phage protein